MFASLFSGVAKALRGAWLLVGAVVVTLVLAELAGRAGYRVLDAASFAIHHRKPPEPTPCERVMAALELGWQPYTYWRGVPSHSDLVNVEADGRRRTWQVPGLDAAAPLTTMIGGSAAWGMCVPDDETIPSYLAKQLAGQRVPARVENHAQIGWVSTQSMLDLTLDLRAGRVPRVVVLYDGWNDIVAGFAEGSPGAPLNEGNRVAEFNLLTHLGRMRLHSIGNPMNSALGRLARTLQRKLGRGAAVAPAPTGRPFATIADTSEAKLDSLAREVVRVYEWNVSHVEGLGRTYGFRPLFVWQPDIVGKTTRSPGEQKTVAKNPRMVRFGRLVRRALSESAFLRDCPGFHNLVGAFDGDEAEFFYDWCHVTAQANERIASEISKAVAEALAGPAPR